jgi:Domain of unknown function (DUF4258)
VIRYTDHAEDRMAERGVTKEDVQQALRRRIRVTPGPPGRLWVWGYAQHGRVLKVGVSSHDQEFVTTVAWPGD